jgi:hypothetical protein
MPGIERDGWFVDTSTGQVGPISSAALERLVSTGEVRLTTLVWHESLKHWKSDSRAGSRADLRAVADPFFFGRVKVTNCLSSAC